MDLVNGMRYLIATVETGSLSGAAKKLQVSQPAVSQIIANLEAYFGEVLIARHKRGVSLTSAGEVVFAHGKQVVAEIEEAHLALAQLRNEVTGKVRLTCAQALAETIIGEAMLELQKQHPKLRTEIKATDRLVDIEKEQFDIAVRIGTAGFGGGMVRRIGDVEGRLVASPKFLDINGHPQSAKMLSQMDYIQYRQEGKSGDLLCDGPEGDVIVNLAPGILAQQPNLILQALKMGLGYSVLPLFFVSSLLESGELVEALPGVRPKSTPIFFVVGDNLQNTQRGKVVQEALLQHLASAPGITLTRDIIRRLQAA